jgi:formylglycine-generating enzyme required for sulfatase activity
MQRPLRVFLCHASQDKPAVRELYNALKEEGWIDPWLDKAKILPGQDWEMVIEKAVEDSDAVVICLSSRSVSKEGFVQREIRYAYDIALEKPEETIFLIPLRLNDCIVPRKLRSFHWVDYFGSEKKSSYSDLLEALNLRYEQKMRLEDGNDKQEIINAEKIKTSSRILPDKAENQGFFQDLSEAIWRFGKPYIWFGSILLIGLFFLGINALLNQKPTVPLSEQNTATATTPMLTKTPTKVPPTATNTLPPTFIPTPDIGSTMISEKDGMVMIFVPAGEFTMGSNSSNQADERPEHTVILGAFWIDQTEVTNAMYAKCVNENQCAPPKILSSSNSSNYFGNPEFDTYPVHYVGWNMAKAYCEWAGRRLPTEAEWEKTARGTDERIYPWGNAEPRAALLNYNSNVGTTTEVGSYPSGVSPYGAYDMAGNVWEWVSSMYQTYPYSVDDGRENLSALGSRVMRGGAWDGNDFSVRSTSRYWFDPTYTDYLIGFRCALSQP